MLQDIKFITYMTNEELKLSAEFATALLEKLKNINNNGMNRQIYEQLVDRFEDEEMYGLSGYFLLRAIMKMHSNEC